MLVTIPRPMNGDNRQSAWLSTDAGLSFNPISLPTSLPTNVMLTQCFYGNSNGNAYVTPHDALLLNVPFANALDTR